MRGSDRPPLPMAVPWLPFVAVLLGLVLLAWLVALGTAWASGAIAQPEILLAPMRWVAGDAVG